ncbi:MAG: hypothetical protein ABIS50_15355 [Luteolibacter sp.]|uniref:hypothetical protein n=1 Tax=Luteolibacter sp. TaxID=1962973 RepID=UPI003267E4B7
MFFAYRSGKQPISAKAWRKLEAVERAAGTGSAPLHPQGENGPVSNPASSESVLNDAQVEYRAAPYAINTQPQALANFRQEMEAMRAKLDALEIPFRMSALKDLMEPFNAWPPAGDDLEMTHAALFEKYLRKESDQ